VFVKRKVRRRKWLKKMEENKVVGSKSFVDN